MDRNFNQVLLDMHYSINASLDSDLISEEETETLIFLDQSILEYIQEEDRKNGVEC